MNIQLLLNEKISEALVKAGAAKGTLALVRPSSKPQFGDYQANGVMGAAKQMGMNPRELAQKVIDLLDVSEVISKTEIAGPGFINLFLADEFVIKAAQTAKNDIRLGVNQNGNQTIVIDYSGPNVAKEMHVGHLRSTIIGDAVVRTLEFLGNKVIRANHIGDWGTQFGMLIANLERVQQDTDAQVSLELSDLEEFYRQSKLLYDEDPKFAETARNYVVKLQGGDPFCLEMWKKLVDITMVQNQKNYDRLNVSLTTDNVMGESLYNPMLPAIVADLKAKGLATVDDGATVVFLDEYKNKEGDPIGVIVQKRDGGYLYATTDIACAKYRYETLGADRVLYFIDSRQHQHLQQAWLITRKAGYVPENVSLEHHAFGMMLDRSGKPFKTRTGGTVKLADLLDEAKSRALALIEQKNPELEASEQDNIAETVAIAAVKYSDLSKNRTTDYVFDWDIMLSFDGNTAPYMQYAYTRVSSIFTKAGIAKESLTGDILISHPKERELLTQLLRFEEVIQSVAQEGSPHLLCSYLYEIAGIFSSFYEACPILNAEEEATRASRLNIAALCAKTLQLGLSLLGIKTLDKM